MNAQKLHKNSTSMSHSSSSLLAGASVRCPAAIRGFSQNLLGSCTLGRARSLRKHVPCARVQCRAVPERATCSSENGAGKSNAFNLDSLEAAYNGRGAAGPPSTSYKPAQGQKLYLQGRKKSVQGPVRMLSQPGKGRKGGKKVETTERLSKARMPHLLSFLQACM